MPASVPYEYKVVKPSGVRRNVGWGFCEKLTEQLNDEARNGWEFHRSIDTALVFRRPT